MKKIILLATATCLMAASFRASAQTDEEMKKWTEYMTPGDMHKMIASWDGKWTGEITMWMAPDAPPSKSTGASENKTELGGRYQVSTYSGEFSGMPFQGMSILAYDNAKKVFESIWIDNMGTGVMHLSGPWNPATKTITLTGNMIDPTTGKEVFVKELFRIIDNDTQIMEMYAPMPDGKEFKTMEIKYRRNK